MKRLAILAGLLALGCHRPPPAPARLPRVLRPDVFIPAIEPGRSVDDWMKDLFGGDDHRVDTAMLNLAWLKGAAVPKLSECLASPEPKKRRMAAGVLSRMKDGAAAPAIAPLEALLRDPDPEVRYAAASAFEWMGPKAAPSAPALVRAIMEEDDHVTLSFASALLDALTGLGAAGEEALIEGLREPDTHKAAKAFAFDRRNMGRGDLAISLLERALRTHKDAAVRRQAVLVLGSLWNDRSLAIPTLVKSLLDDDSPAVRAASARLLGRLAEGDKDVGELALPALGEASNDADPAVKHAAKIAAQRANAGSSQATANAAARREEELKILESRGNAKEASDGYRALLEDYPDVWGADRWSEALKKLEGASK